MGTDDRRPSSPRHTLMGAVGTHHVSRCADRTRPCGQGRVDGVSLRLRMMPACPRERARPRSSVPAGAAGLCSSSAGVCWLEVGLPTRSRGRLTLQVAASTSSRRVRNRCDLDAPCDRCVHRQRFSSVPAGELLTVRVRTPIARAWRLALCGTARSVRRACWPKPHRSFQSRTVHTHRCRRQNLKQNARRRCACQHGAGIRTNGC